MLFVKNKEKVRILYHQNEDVGGWQRDFAETNMYWAIRMDSDDQSAIIYQWECPAMFGWGLGI